MSDGGAAIEMVNLCYVFWFPFCCLSLFDGNMFWNISWYEFWDNLLSFEGVYGCWQLQSQFLCLEKMCLFIQVHINKLLLHNVFGRICMHNYNN